MSNTEMAIYFSFTLWIWTLSLGSLLAGVAAMAGISKENWEMRSHALGCALIATALLLHGICITGAKKWSPRRVIMGEVGGYERDDSEQNGSLYLYADTAYTVHVNGSKSNPLPQGFWDRIDECTVKSERTEWNNDAQEITVFQPPLHPRQTVALPVGWTWRAPAGYFWIAYLELSLGVLFLAAAAVVLWAARHNQPLPKNYAGMFRPQ